MKFEEKKLVTRHQYKLNKPPLMSSLGTLPQKQKNGQVDIDAAGSP